MFLLTILSLSGLVTGSSSRVIQLQLPGIDELFYRYASEKQLEYIHVPIKLAFETFDASVSIRGSENTKTLSRVDPGKIIVSNRASADLIKMVMHRMAAGEYHWVGTQFPTNSSAQDAEMSLFEYEEMVFNACLPDADDPVGYWKRFSAWQQKVVDWFVGKKHAHITCPGTDLHLGIAGRPFINCDGHENMPDGEIYSSPVEDSVEGFVAFTYPIGTNESITRFTRNTLFDEKINGTFHLALGMGFPECSSKNESAIHWDIVCDLRRGGEIWIDDELLYKDGKFVIEFN